MIPGDHLEDSVDINHGVVWLEGISDDETTRGLEQQVLDGEGEGAAIVEHETYLLLLLLFDAQIRAAAVLLHYAETANRKQTRRGSPQPIRADRGRRRRRTRDGEEMRGVVN